MAGGTVGILECMGVVGVCGRWIGPRSRLRDFLVTRCSTTSCFSPASEPCDGISASELRSNLLRRRLLIGIRSEKTVWVVSGMGPVAVDTPWRASVGGAVTGEVGILLMLGRSAEAAVESAGARPFVMPLKAPSTLYYRCSSRGNAGVCRRGGYHECSF